MGHSLQAVSLLIQAAASVFAVPLAIRIHEGVVWSNRDRRTLLDKMLALLGIVAIAEPCYFVADAYYAARRSRHRSAQREQPPGHAGEVRTPSPTPPISSAARASKAGPGSMAARSSSAPCCKIPRAANRPKVPSTASARWSSNMGRKDPTVRKHTVRS